MPIKQVTCSICNTLVNKAVTYSVGKDQRACKVHEGVTEKRGQMELERLQKTQAAIREQKRRERSDFLRSQPQPPPSFGPKCWVCMNDGLRQDEYFQRVMIEIEKAQLAPGDKTLLEMLFPKMEKRCIFVLSKDKCANALKYVRDEFMDLVNMTGILAICGPCCGNLKIEALRTPDPKQLAACTVAYQIIKPVIQEIAKAELAEAK